MTRETREREKSVNNRKWLRFVGNSPHCEGRQREKERPLQSQRSTADVAVGLVNLVLVQLLTLHQTHTNSDRQTGLIDFGCQNVLSMGTIWDSEQGDVSNRPLAYVIFEILLMQQMNE